MTVPACESYEDDTAAAVVGLVAVPRASTVSQTVRPDPPASEYTGLNSFRYSESKKRLLTHHLGLLCRGHSLTPEVWIVHAEQKIDSTILITTHRF